MKIGVLGGGLQGCTIALALAERGADVTIFDRNDALLTGVAIANEGKIHLGYTYAGDPSLATAKTMIKGALAFAPFFARHLSAPELALPTSIPAVYGVHRESQRPVEDVCRYLKVVHALIMEAAESEPGAYFGKDLKAAPRAWSRAEIEQNFNPVCLDAAFDTVEVAINPVELGKTLRACIVGHPGIETALNRIVTRAKVENNAVWVETEHKKIHRERFDHVVNALWGGRLALDHSVGLYSNRPWLHRLKYGVSVSLPPGAQIPLSSTFVLGPFGEVVSYGDGTIYLTWYPECLQGISRELLPPNWANHPDEPLRSQIVHRTVEALSEVVPSLRQIDPKDLLEAQVKGGVIVAGG
jgi:glycine/D-amino acid oxidase-like deaminating enzyme